MTAIGMAAEDKGEFVQAFRENVIRIIGSYSEKAEPTEFGGRISELAAELMKLIELCAKEGYSEEVFDQEYKVITEELKTLRREREQASREKQLADAYEERVEKMDRYMKRSKGLGKEFDDELVWRLIQNIKVINENKIKIQFHTGIVMTQRLDLWEN